MEIMKFAVGILFFSTISSLTCINHFSNSISGFSFSQIGLSIKYSKETINIYYPLFFPCFKNPLLFSLRKIVSSKKVKVQNQNVPNPEQSKQLTGDNPPLDGATWSIYPSKKSLVTRDELRSSRFKSNLDAVGVFADFKILRATFSSRTTSSLYYCIKEFKESYKDCLGYEGTSNSFVKGANSVKPIRTLYYNLISITFV